MKVLCIICGILMIIGGFYGIMNPGITFVNMTWLIGGIMAGVGVAGVIMYFVNKKSGYLGASELISAILTALLGIVVMTKPVLSDVLLGYIFGAWIFVTGITQITSSFADKKLGFSWIPKLITGILSVLIGFYAAFHPLVSVLAIGIMIGINFMSYGINLITLGALWRK